MHMNIGKKKKTEWFAPTTCMHRYGGTIFFPYSWLLRFKHVLTDVVIQIENGVIWGVVMVHMINCCRIP